VDRVGLAAGPRVEWLLSPLDPAEEYEDLGAAIELDPIGMANELRMDHSAHLRIIE